MVVYSVDDSGRILTLSYSGSVTPGEIDACLRRMRERLTSMRPGFVVLSDLTNLIAMEADCAEDLGAIMEVCSERGMALALRVIPDPSKDIGFGLISLFHCEDAVRTITVPSLAEAISFLLGRSQEFAHAA